jgi:cytoskeletal protein CcmA (bactofilin family)
MKKKAFYKNYFYLFLFFLLGLTNIGSTDSSIVYPDQYNDNNVILRDSLPLEYLYTAGKDIIVDQDVQKNAYIAGQNILINSNINGSLHIVGLNIDCRGYVGENAHFAAQDVVIDGIVHGDLFVAGQSVSLSRNTVITRNVYVAAEDLSIGATIHGNIDIAAGEAYLNSPIMGSVEARVGILELGPNTRIEGDLRYYASDPVITQGGATILGTEVYTSMDYDDAQDGFGGVFAGRFIFYVFSVIAKLFITLITALVLVYAVPKMSLAIVNTSLKHFWCSLGVGLASLFLIPITIGILIFTIIGVGLFALLGAIFMVLLVLAGAFTILLLGSVLIKIISKKDFYQVRWQEAIVGFLASLLLFVIPILGWLVLFIFFLLSLGSITFLAYQQLKNNRR